MKNSLLSVLCAVGFALLIFASFSEVEAQPYWHNQVMPPKVVSAPKPEYPQELKDAGIGGVVWVSVEVNEKGKVKVNDAFGPIAPCSDLKNSRTEPLRKAAFKAAKQIVFEPPLKAGQPASIRLDLRYEFNAAKKTVTSGGAEPPIAGKVLNGRALELHKPKFPTGVDSSYVQETIYVDVLIDEEGNVIMAGPTSGDRAFRDEAVKAACRSRFSPTTIGGTPVKVSGTIVYNFVR